MFSWSNNNNNSSTSRTNSTYPGRRGAAATSIEGSIRPPSSSHQHHTRKQHLTSYIEDPTLQKSTRKVSSGTYVVFSALSCFVSFCFFCLSSLYKARMLLLCTLLKQIYLIHTNCFTSVLFTFMLMHTIPTTIITTITITIIITITITIACNQ